MDMMVPKNQASSVMPNTSNTSVAEFLDTNISRQKNMGPKSKLVNQTLNG
jgi:hypothetical protein